VHLLEDTTCLSENVSQQSVSRANFVIPYYVANFVIPYYVAPNIMCCDVPISSINAMNMCNMFVSLAFQPIVVVFSQPDIGL
jgi:hypothetical protein